MIACGIFLMVAVVLWIIGRKKLSMEKKKMLGIVALAAVLGLLTGMVNDADSVLTEKYLMVKGYSIDY